MQTTINGPAKPAGDVYLPTDVSPEELFQAIGRLRKEAQDEIDRLLAFLDSLGWTSSGAYGLGGDKEQEHDGREPDTDAERDDADMEPSLGWPETYGCGGAGMGGFDDREEVRQ